MDWDTLIKTALICIPATVFIVKAYDFITYYLDAKAAHIIIDRVCEEHAQELIESIAAEVASNIEFIPGEQNIISKARAEVTD